MKTFRILIVILSILFSCANEESENKDFRFEDFEKELKVGMDYSQMVSKFGEPNRDIGSGIHIYVYELSDSTEVWIGYTDEIIYVKHQR